MVRALILLVLLGVTAQGHALSDAEPGNKRVEEGSVSMDTDAASHMSSRGLDKRLNNILTLVGNLLNDLLDIPTAPTAFDWRDHAVVTGVKDQGQCNSSWAFAAVGSVESINTIKTGVLVALSEQQLIDCSSSYGNSGCGGGSVDSAFQYIIDNGGIDSEQSYPYEGTVGQCRYKLSDKAAQITNYKDVTPQGNEDALLAAVNNQPVAVTVDASHDSFQTYTSGVYYEPLCSPTNLNHAMLVVGYGTNSAGEDYWIVKNSYGIGWGMKGYILMARNRSNNCGIASRASFPIS